MNIPKTKIYEKSLNVNGIFDLWLLSDTEHSIYFIDESEGETRESQMGNMSFTCKNGKIQNIKSILSPIYLFFSSRKSLISSSNLRFF